MQFVLCSSSTFSKTLSSTMLNIRYSVKSLHCLLNGSDSSVSSIRFLSACSAVEFRNLCYPLICSRIFIPSNPYLNIQFRTIEEWDIQICSAFIPGECAAVSCARSFSNSVGDKSLTFWSTWAKDVKKRGSDRKLHDHLMQCYAGQVEESISKYVFFTCRKVSLTPTIKNYHLFFVTAFSNGGCCCKYPKHNLVALSLASPNPPCGADDDSCIAGRAQV